MNAVCLTSQASLFHAQDLCDHSASRYLMRLDIALPRYPSACPASPGRLPLEGIWRGSGLRPPLAGSPRHPAESSSTCACGLVVHLQLLSRDTSRHPQLLWVTGRRTFARSGLAPLWSLTLSDALAGVADAGPGSATPATDCRRNNGKRLHLNSFQSQMIYRCHNPFQFARAEKIFDVSVRNRPCSVLHPNKRRQLPQMWRMDPDNSRAIQVLSSSVPQSIEIFARCADYRRRERASQPQSSQKEL